MKTIVLGVFACLLASLGGCAVYIPSGVMVIDPAPIAVPASRGGFCPPGHAKKGN